MDFKSGYSARTLDTKITANFFKRYFPKYANKESAFLTLATREKIRWTIKDGKNLKIRDKEVKNSFLEILDSAQNNKIKPQDFLIYIFIKLKLLSQHHTNIYEETIQTSSILGTVDINVVLEMLQRHFNSKLSSRLPVIAIYSVYQDLFKTVKRYNKKTLLPLNVHTSSDKHGFGDIEIYNSDKTPFEIIEIKHNIAIDRNIIFDVCKKSEKTTTKRYYILTTNENNFISKEEEKYIKTFILNIQREYGLEIIPNGIYNSIKYYLRFIENYNDFIKSYTNNLIEDSKNSTEIKDFHITNWEKILKEHNIN